MIELLHSLRLHVALVLSRLDLARVKSPLHKRLDLIAGHELLLSLPVLSLSVRAHQTYLSELLVASLCAAAHLNRSLSLQ